MPGPGRGWGSGRSRFSGRSRGRAGAKTEAGVGPESERGGAKRQRDPDKPRLLRGHGGTRALFPPPTSQSSSRSPALAEIGAYFHYGLPEQAGLSGQKRAKSGLQGGREQGAGECWQAVAQACPDKRGYPGRRAPQGPLCPHRDRTSGVVRAEGTASRGGSSRGLGARRRRDGWSSTGTGSPCSRRRNPSHRTAGWEWSPGRRTGARTSNPAPAAS